MRKLWSFVQYNNAVPIALGIVFLGAGGVFAASPDAQQAIYSAEDSVQSVDNTYVVGVDLAQRDFGLHVTKVEEDAENYYVSYEYKTISVVDYVWQEVNRAKSMTVSKKEILGTDLGLFVGKQLGQEIAYELRFLGEVQEKERTAGTSLKTVATIYSGLIGRMLDPTEKTFPGYVPVVEEMAPSTGPGNVAAAAGAVSTQISLPPIPTQDDIKQMVDAAIAAALAGSTPAPATTTPDTQPVDTEPVSSPPPSGTPVITINGENPARIPMGAVYLDLGATVSDDIDTNLGVHTFLDGVEMDLISINTAAAATYTITYKATDNDGNVGEATRTVEVYDPAPPPPPPDDGDGTATTTPPSDTGTTTPPISPTPAPEPTPPPPDPTPTPTPEPDPNATSTTPEQ